jgi:hypothetical protein
MCRLRNIAMISLLIAGAAFAQNTNASRGTNSSQGTLDGEKPVNNFKESKTFTAIFKGKAFIAWTGDENDSLNHHQLKALVEERAKNICLSFGYQAASVDMESISQVPPAPPPTPQNKKPRPVSRENNYLALEGGKLVIVHDADQGTLAQRNLKAVTLVLAGTVDLARFFHEITCYR